MLAATPQDSVPGVWTADFPPQLRLRAGTTTRGWPGGGWFGRAGPAGQPPVQRQALAESLRTPGIQWLNQVHGVEVLRLPAVGDEHCVDAAWTDQPGVVCAVLTADCLPVLLAAEDGSAVAAVHAGWRGLLGGVLERSVTALPVASSRLHAWLGPAIGPGCFEIGPEVRSAFLDNDSATVGHFQPGQGDRWFADLYGLARHRLVDCGIPAAHIRGGSRCTMSESNWFHSYRRDGAASGRMASYIMLE